jgi:hypothetical protein
MASTFVNHPETYLAYRGLKVSKDDWVSFIKDIGFKEYAKRCIVEDDGSKLQETKFLAKLTQMKSTKRGTIVYEEGTEYDGAREAGRPNGRGTLKYGERRGTYDGEFVQGRRHGYGVEQCYVAPEV